MKKFIRLFVFSLLLAGCSSQTSIVPSSDEPQEESSSSEEETQVTTNVTYRGTLEKAGISIYMEGTHRLSLPEGRVLLLQSSALDLNGYIGEEVFVTGDIRPTVEAGGIIMDVKDIALADGGQASSAESTSGESSADASSIPSSVTAVSSAPASVAPVVSSRASAAGASSVAAQTSSAPPSQSASDAAQVRATAMAKSDLSQGWSQQYCSVHIGFCVPVHKNWWFKSFGTTTNFLWHVEIGPEELQSLGDGPLVVNLVSGSLQSVGVRDLEIRAQGDYVVGYRVWTDNRHFEITAPSNLRTAVQYMTDHVAVSEATQ